jgi:hypothetical protein
VVVRKVVHHSLPRASVVLTSVVSPLPEFGVCHFTQLVHEASDLCDIAAVAFASCKRLHFFEQVQCFCLHSVQSLKQAILREDPGVEEGARCILLLV